MAFFDWFMRDLLAIFNNMKLQSIHSFILLTLQLITFYNVIDILSNYDYNSINFTIFIDRKKSMATRFDVILTHITVNFDLSSP